MLLHSEGHTTVVYNEEAPKQLRCSAFNMWIVKVLFVYNDKEKRLIKAWKTFNNFNPLQEFDKINIIFFSTRVSCSVI